MKKILFSSLSYVGLLALALNAGNSANAASITFGGVADGASGMTTSVLGAQINTFDNGILPANYTATLATPIVSGSVTNIYAAPKGDTTSYLTTGTGSVSIDYSNAINYFGLYWGSVDSYNSLLFTKTDGTTETYSGNNFAAEASINGRNSMYVNFNDNSGLGWSNVTLTSTQNAFEVDNIATTTPEPASMALLGLGALAVGALAARRRKIARA